MYRVCTLAGHTTESNCITQNEMDGIECEQDLNELLYVKEKHGISNTLNIIMNSVWYAHTTKIMEAKR